MYVETVSGMLVNLDKVEFVNVVVTGDEYALKAYWPGEDEPQTILVTSFTEDHCQQQKSRIREGMIEGLKIVVIERPAAAESA